MRKFNKSALLAGASALALGLTLNQAKAFDEVDWDWFKLVDENVVIDVDIDTILTPTGHVEVEKLQISLGDKNAVAFLDNFSNDLPLSGETVQTTLTGDAELQVAGTAEGYVDIEWTPETGNDPNDETGFVGIAGQPEGTSITEGVDDPEGPDVVAGSNGGEDPFVVEGTATGEISVSGEVFVPDPFDATTQLPKVEVAALALGNSESIDSAVATYVNEGQFTFNVNEGDPEALAGWDEGADNDHNALAEDALSAALVGFIAPSNLTATATANNVEQAQLEVSATSIANNHAIDLQPGSDQDSVLIADLTQFAYANNNAFATVNTHTLSNWDNLGEIEGPVLDVSATAAGNISNISVGSCGSCEVVIDDPTDPGSPD